MKLNKDEGSADQITFSISNNTKAVGGYDGYSGTYEVIETTGKVAHTLTGLINTPNIVSRIQLPVFW
ncbi:MAG TPA: hypothetical protein VFI29_15910 [Hanamia sp.]|nr:hypothetical protein [Hanamia sp.]